MLSSPFSSEIGPHTREDIQRFVNISSGGGWGGLLAPSKPSKPASLQARASRQQ